MASSKQADRQHHDAQTAMVLAMGGGVAQLWSLVDPMDLADTLPLFTRGAEALVRQHASAARSLSARHYRQQRLAAGVRTPFRPPLTTLPTSTQVEQVIERATEPLWSPKGGDLTGVDVYFAAEANVEAGLEQLVMDTARNEAIEAIEADQKARGWYRVTKPHPCFFCAMLAARGAVYTRETVKFRAHPRCRCTAEPSFADHHEPSAEVRRWQQLWADSTQGKSGTWAKQKAFRRAYEGRADGPVHKSHRRDGSPAETPTLGFDSLTVDQLRKQLAAVEGITKDTEWKRRQIKRYRDRLAELGE